jgi:AmmeMemoRadiSam system protein A
MELTDAQGVELVGYAHAKIAEALGGAKATRPSGDWADTWGATFVTLRRAGGLHGCIGSIEARRAIADDVGHNAVAAALADPRAVPIDLDGARDLAVEISVLSPLTPVPSADEDEAIAALRPGIDGVVIRGAGHQGTFLPQVWKDLPDRNAFFRELKQKAGIAKDHWSPEMKVFRYSMVKFTDRDFDAREGTKSE